MALGRQQAFHMFGVKTMAQNDLLLSVARISRSVAKICIIASCSSLNDPAARSNQEPYGRIRQRGPRRNTHALVHRCTIYHPKTHYHYLPPQKGQREDQGEPQPPKPPAAAPPAGVAASDTITRNPAPRAIPRSAGNHSGGTIAPLRQGHVQSVPISSMQSLIACQSLRRVLTRHAHQYALVSDFLHNASMNAPLRLKLNPTASGLLALTHRAHRFPPSPNDQTQVATGARNRAVAHGSATLRCRFMMRNRSSVSVSGRSGDWHCRADLLVNGNQQEKQHKDDQEHHSPTCIPAKDPTVIHAVTSSHPHSGVKARLIGGPTCAIAWNEQEEEYKDDEKHHGPTCISAKRSVHRISPFHTRHTATYVWGEYDSRGV